MPSRRKAAARTALQSAALCLGATAASTAFQALPCPVTPRSAVRQAALNHAADRSTAGSSRPGDAGVAIAAGAAGMAAALAGSRRGSRSSLQGLAMAAQREPEIQANGFLGNVKDFFQTLLSPAEELGDAIVKNVPSPSAAYHKPPNPASVRVRVSSQSKLGLPFCGEYEEQPFRMNDRPVYKKLGMPAESQAVYLLYNEADQWAFTPHGDGRPDGWAFVEDAAKEPEQLVGVFSVWDGAHWTVDSSLKVQGPASAAKEPGKEASSIATAQASSASPAAAAEPQQLASLPEEVQPLSLLHWKAHWAASQRTLYHWSEPRKELMEQSLPDHPGVHRGVLPNGLRYVIMKNAMPPGRFEAHIELHVGSVDEGPNEQGIAHMMEHVCFLGSRKRERLIGTGSRSNALTDFQHTIYHFHAPLKLEDGRGMYLPVLEALQEIAFTPEFNTNRIEKERKAVLAEMQQVNDMEYRIETWTLAGLHETNKLGTQFPIGKEEQIKMWQQKDLQNFHNKWYYPGNSTLYVVGDMPIEDMISGIHKVFETTPGRHEFSPGKAKAEPVWGEASADARSLFRPKLAQHRPEQLHNFCLPMIGTYDVYTEAAAFNTAEGGRPWHGPIRIIRNELLEGLQVNFYAKTPVRPLRTQEDIKHLIGVRILIGVLQFRIVSRYSSNHAPVTIDHSDSFREGCAVTAITVNAAAQDWGSALACVVQEVRAICDYGITEGEMTRYMEAMLKDVEKGVTESDSVPSEDHLNFIMTSDVFDHTIMHPTQSYEAFKEVANYVDMAQIHNTAKWLLGFLGYYGMAAAPPMTSIVVCAPTQTFEEHNQKWVPFNITEEQIVDLLSSVPDKSREDAMNMVEVPQSLLKDQLETLLAQSPIDAFTAWRATSRKVDSATGIAQLVLPNGAKVNYACTTNESQGTLRILVPGGKSADEPGQYGSAMVGIRTVSESGAVSSYSREQIELFAVSNLMSVHLDLNLEFAYIDSTFGTGDRGLIPVLELLHLLFQEPRWELPAFVRAQQAYKAQAYASNKSLETSTMNRLMGMMYTDPRVLEPKVEDINKLTMAKVKKTVSAQLRPQDLEINLVADFEGRGQSKLAGMRGTGSGLSTGKHREDSVDEPEIELPAVGFERRLVELEENLWKYLGSLPPSEVPRGNIHRGPQMRKDLLPEERQSAAHMEDSDERAVANIGGNAPNRWGKGDEHHAEVMKARGFSWQATNSNVKDHPLYPSVCLLALREVLNTRLFSTVRDSLGLSYDCSFEMSMLDRLEAGWYSCTVSAHPSRIMEAVTAAKGVLAGPKRRPINDSELSSARRMLLRRHETDVQTNEYWISLLTHLQYENPKDISCIRDLEVMLKALTWQDVQNAYTTLLTDADQVFVSISTAGPGASYISGGAAPAAVSTSNAQKQLIVVD